MPAKSLGILPIPERTIEHDLSLRRLLGHTHHAVVAFVALFMALGGTGAYAQTGISAATFAGPLPAGGYIDSTLRKVSSKNLPAGSWVITATASIRNTPAADSIRTIWCEVRNGEGFIGGAVNTRRYPGPTHVSETSLSMTGGAQVPPGGGEVSMWCRLSYGSGSVVGAQMMILQVGGFF